MAFQTGGITYGRGDARDWSSYYTKGYDLTDDHWFDKHKESQYKNTSRFGKIQGDPYWDYWSDYKLDPSRDWKTTWGAQRPLDSRGRDSRSWAISMHGGDGFDSWHDPAYAGWEKGVHMTTGRSTYSKGGHRGGVSYQETPLLEVLDYNAYQRDPWYTSGWSGLGREGQISSVQDILDVEEWYAGSGARDAERQRQAQAQLDATNEQIALLQQQLEDARKPRQIDVGQGQTVGEGGVADYVLGLEQQRARDLDALTQQLTGQYNTQLSDAKLAWQTQSASDLDALTSRLQQQYGTQISGAERNAELQRQQMGQQLRAEYDQKLEQAQAGWADKSQQERYALTQQLTDQYRTEYDKRLADAQAQWQSASATQERAYDARIADLTAGWDTQRSMYDTSLANLSSQLGHQQSVYDSRISDLSGQIGEQQRAYGDLSSQFAQQRQDWSKQQAEWGAQRTAYDTSLSNLNKSISDYQAREQKRLQEAAIEAQRARTAAAYARDGGPVNPSVGGVKTQRGLTDARRNRYGTSFKRADMTITNKQLNI